MHRDLEIFYFLHKILNKNITNQLNMKMIDPWLRALSNLKPRRRLCEWGSFISYYRGGPLKYLTKRELETYAEKSEFTKSLKDGRLIKVARDLYTGFYEYLDRLFTEILLRKKEFYWFRAISVSWFYPLSSIFIIRKDGDDDRVANRVMQ